MMGELNGRVALVTGSSRGIGAAVARRLAGAGAAVAVNSHASPDAAAAVAAEIATQDGQALAVPADVTDREVVDRLIARVREAWGRLDIVVCAAGLNRDQPFLQMVPADWQCVLDVNLNGTFHVCQAAAPALLDSGHGAIVTFGADGLPGPAPRGELLRGQGRGGGPDQVPGSGISSGRARQRGGAGLDRDRRGRRAPAPG